MAASLELANDPATGGPGNFAAEEIRREAAAIGMALGDDANATRIAITVEKDNSAAAESYRIRVKKEGDRRVITVRGADATGAMYGGLDVAEAIRTGAFDTLKDSDHTPHIAQRGIKFNLPLDVRTPTYNKGEWPDSERLNVAEMWSRDFWRETFDDMARHRYNLIADTLHTNATNALAALTELRDATVDPASAKDIPKQTKNVAADVQIARDWKPGTVLEAEIKRSTTVAGFKK